MIIIIKLLRQTIFYDIIKTMDKFFTFQKLTEQELLSVPSVTLAWVGDAIYSLCAREYALHFNRGKPAKLNKMVTSRVNANAQSETLEKLLPILSQEELSVVRRAKNAPTTTKSKHYGIADYKRATAFEALLGYLYLSDKMDRLNELLEIIFGEEK